MPLRVLAPLTLGVILVATLLGIFFFPAAVALVYGVIFFLAPVWLPLILLALAWPLWLTFIRARHVARVQYTTLELTPGEDTPETARAMELVFYSLYRRTDITRADAFLHGKMQNPYSFELYAHDNRVRFFVHVPKRDRLTLEDRIRAEYRDIEIHEMHDYSRELHFRPFHMRILAREYTLGKPDPYPLKTYPAYETTSPKRDVFSEVVESLGAVSKDEHVLFSLIIRPHQRHRQTLFEHPRDTLHEAARKEIRELVGSSGEIRQLSPAVQNMVKAIEVALTKPSFDCGLRALYVADNEHFDESYHAKLDSMLDPFNDPNLNVFRAYDPGHQKGFFLSELFSAVPILASVRLLDLYRRRAFFAPPYYGRPFVLNTEELATLFHLPHAKRGSALARMRGVALLPPENLPV
jgi:hypothetical protein